MLQVVILLRAHNIVHVCVYLYNTTLLSAQGIGSLVDRPMITAVHIVCHSLTHFTSEQATLLHGQTTSIYTI